MIIYLFMCNIWVILLLAFFLDEFFHMAIDVLGIGVLTFAISVAPLAALSMEGILLLESCYVNLMFGSGSLVYVLVYLSY